MAMPPYDAEAFQRQLEEIGAAMPRVAGVSWPMALAVSMLDALDARFPGIRDETRAHVLRRAADMEASGDPEQIEDAPSMRELAEIPTFTGPRARDEEPPR